MCLPCVSFQCWSKRNVCILLAIDIIVSYGSLFPLFSVKFVYERDGDGWKLVGRERTIPEARMTIAIGVIIYEIVSTFLIARTIFVIRNAMNAQNRRKSRQELGLVAVTAIDCILGALECIYEISALGIIDSNNPIFYRINLNYEIYLFLILAMNAFSITFLSSSLRHEVIRCCRRQHSAPTLMLVSSKRSRP
ncbi:hypothetical protein Q1695_015052 [Nippostrongylus brasiliensis]|nr:hypothetical protein Q1695_015052 [Nippostrongylus brasiliensis]